MSETAETFFAIVVMFLLFGLPMILVAWVIVSIVSAPIGWVLVSVASGAFGLAIGYGIGKGRRA